MINRTWAASFRGLPPAVARSYSPRMPSYASLTHETQRTPFYDATSRRFVSRAQETTIRE